MGRYLIVYFSYLTSFHNLYTCINIKCFGVILLFFSFVVLLIPSQITLNFTLHCISTAASSVYPQGVRVTPGVESLILFSSLLAATRQDSSKSFK